MTERPAGREGMGAADRYPPHTVRDLLESDLVTPRTREVLQARLDAPPPAAPRFLDGAALDTLRVAAARLVGMAKEGVQMDLGGLIDERLASGKGDGWRYDTMPPDGEAYRQGLAALDASARGRFGAPFSALSGERQDELLAAVQQGEVTESAWEGLPSARFFEEFLAEVAEYFYSHPLILEEIGYVGMADARGWQAIGLDQLEPWEPRPLRSTGTPDGS